MKTTVLEAWWRGGRAVDRAGLENRRAERPREFESHPLRFPSKWLEITSGLLISLGLRQVHGHKNYGKSRAVWDPNPNSTLSEPRGTKNVNKSFRPSTNERSAPS